MQPLYWSSITRDLTEVLKNELYMLQLLLNGALILLNASNKGTLLTPENP
jgi:hypothetical protein